MAPGDEPIESFPPVVGRRPRVLILGSMPGVRSLDEQRYYAHPQNAFWPILGSLVGADPTLPYPERLRVLRARGIALWDVARSCRRESSADATIRDVIANDVSSLLRRRPSIRAIFCNGRKAQQLFGALLRGRLGAREADLHIGYLPSTSPAHAALRTADKLRTWRVILQFLDDGPGPSVGSLTPDA